MIDFGFDKIALIGAVALIVIGPEKLPRVARTVGHFIGKAQRYVADVKSEVNRSIELDELKKMRREIEGAAQQAEQTLSTSIQETQRDLQHSWNDVPPAVPRESTWRDDWPPAEPLEYKRPQKNWRLKRGATPQWYKTRTGVRTRALSGAARVARFRPPRAGA